MHCTCLCMYVDFYNVFGFFCAEQEALQLPHWIPLHPNQVQNSIVCTMCIDDQHSCHITFIIALLQAFPLLLSSIINISGMYQWPSLADVNTRARRLVSAWVKNQKREEQKQMHLIKVSILHSSVFITQRMICVCINYASIITRDRV